jgi:hypothetical protein
LNHDAFERAAPHEGAEKCEAGAPRELGSAVLRRISANVDAWPIPPAGLCIVDERLVILRSLSPMTVIHETSHLLDLALGGGVYLSGVDPRIRRAFAAATGFVTPYSASACDEYMAVKMSSQHSSGESGIH